MPLTPDTPLSDIRVVTLITGEDLMCLSAIRHMVHRDEVDLLVEASLKLHHDPGINPHTGGRTSPLHQIRVAPLEVSGPHWWTRPSLSEGVGAVIAHPLHGKTVWMSDALRDLRKKKSEAETAAEATMS